MAGKLLVFSPPKVVEGNLDAEVPILLVQPFSKPPQVTFERIPVGCEAVRQLKILNTTNTDHTVTLSDAIRPKGFQVKPNEFTLLPGQHQLVSLVWRPDGSEASSRLAVPVSTDKGYKGRFILLGTVREEPKPLKPARKNPGPKSSILTCSQKPNLSSRAATSVQARKKVDPAPAQACKRAVPPIKVTIPIEFKSSVRRNVGRENRATKVSTPTQLSKKAAPTKSHPRKTAAPPVRATARKAVPSYPNKDATSDPPASNLDVKLNPVTPKVLVKSPIICDPVIAGDAQSLLNDKTLAAMLTPGRDGDLDPLNARTPAGDIRRETFNVPAFEATINATVKNSFKNANTVCENSLEMSNAFEDSLEPGQIAHSANLVTETVSNSDEHSDSGNNDTFELDLSARMEMLYQQILARQPCTTSQGDTPTTTISAMHEQMSGEQAEELLCSPLKAAERGSLLPTPLRTILDGQRSSSPKCPAKASKEDSLPDIKDMLEELELGSGRDPECSDNERSLQEMIQNYESAGLLTDHVRIEDFFPSDISSIK